MSRVYLSGPMTNRPQFNIPLFIAAAEVLRGLGYDVVSPVELDGEEVKALALQSPDGKYDANGSLAGSSWGEYLARDVRVIADGAEREWIDSSDLKFSTSRLPIDAIVLLPEWETSRGAKLEAFVGVLTGKQFYTYELALDTKDDEGNDIGKRPMLVERGLGWVMLQIADFYGDAISTYIPLDTAQV